MNRTILLTLLGVMFLSLLCGCPRTDDNGGTSTSTPASTPPASSTSTSDPADDNPCAADENPCAGEENPCGEAENPCADAENPCADAENPCADAENPCAANPCGENPCAGDENPCAPEGPEDEVTTVVLETTDGDIVLEVHSAWSPLGAAHFLELVEAGFYDGAPWFRVLDGFVAQCGVAKDPAMNEEWGEKTIQDEPVVVGNKRGFVAFGKNQLPNSRSTHIFINYSDNSGSLNPQGFACFAQVVEGMDVADGLFKCQFDRQDILAKAGGMDAFKQRFPDADYINRAYIRE